MRAWTADGEPLETLVRLYAIESGQPEISRTKREGLLDRYGFADGAGTAYFRVHESRDVEHAAEVRELIAELADERRRGRARRRRRVGVPRQLAPARRGLDRARGARGDGDLLGGIVLGLALGLAIVAIFVFVFSEDTVDAPSIDEGADGCRREP